MPALVESVLGEQRISEPIRALGSFDQIDYADQFTLHTDADASPEAWARAMFGDEPSAGEIVIWRGLLGLRLDRRRSPSVVAGWPIVGRGDGWIRLEAASWLMTANLLVVTAEGTASLVTLVRYDSVITRGVWTLLSAVHRRLAPNVLRKAAARIQR